MTHLMLVEAAPVKDAVVVVPTLNEQGNIARLLDAVLAADARLHVVVVDDGSTDGTQQTVARMALEQAEAGESRIHLIARGRKLGYASALQDGMCFALDRGAQAVLQMDADFSHDPSYLPTLLSEIERYDLVIGSRYTRGGGTRDWGIHRKLLSWAGNVLARVLLRLPMHDCTGGFRCWRADILRDSGVLDLSVEGYAFQVATLDLCRRIGAHVHEVPIIFADRRHGQSKMDGRIIREAASVLFRLALRGNRRLSVRDNAGTSADFVGRKVA